jgi:hypothetical protein
MALDVLIAAGNLDAGSNIKTALSLTPAYIGGVRNFSENDPGLATGGTPYLASPEVDDDFRLRVSNDVCLDEEDLTYSAQNFVKYGIWATTFVPAFTTTGLNLNSTNITTASAAILFRTYKTFSMEGTETLSFDMEGSLNAALVANIAVEFGFGLTAVTAPYDVFDGVYIRMNSAGVYGVLRNNSARTSSRPQHSRTSQELPGFP